MQTRLQGSIKINVCYAVVKQHDTHSGRMMSAFCCLPIFTAVVSVELKTNPEAGGDVCHMQVRLYRLQKG